MNPSITTESLPEHAGRLVKTSPESTEWFSLEGIFGEKLMLKEFNSNRLHVYTVGEVTLWLVEVDELTSGLGLAVIEVASFSPKEQKKTGEPVLV